MEGWANDLMAIRKRHDVLERKLLQAQLIRRLPGHPLPDTGLRNDVNVWCVSPATTKGTEYSSERFESNILVLDTSLGSSAVIRIIYQGKLFTAGGDSVGVSGWFDAQHHNVYADAISWTDKLVLASSRYSA